MDAKSKEIFDKILTKDKETLDQSELGFLMARRGYMTDEDRKRYSAEIKLHEQGKLLVSETRLEDMSLKDLKAEAKKRKVDVAGLKNTKEIVRALKSAEGESDEE